MTKELIHFLLPTVIVKVSINANVGIVYIGESISMCVTKSCKSFSGNSINGDFYASNRQVRA